MDTFLNTIETSIMQITASVLLQLSQSWLIWYIVVCTYM